MDTTIATTIGTTTMARRGSAEPGSQQDEQEQARDGHGVAAAGPQLLAADLLAADLTRHSCLRSPPGTTRGPGDRDPILPDDLVGGERRADPRGFAGGGRPPPASRPSLGWSTVTAAPPEPPAGPVGSVGSVGSVVVLVSGSGTLLQALIDASADPAYGVRVAAVGADRDGIEGLARAERAGIPTFVRRVADFPDRGAWDRSLAEAAAAYEPTLVVSAGFLKLVGPAFLSRFAGRYVNSHNALLPSFPGIHGPRDALDYGVKVTGATLFVVDEGIDTGVVVGQVAVPVEDGDTVDTLTERIKAAERPQLVDLVGRMVREGFTVTDRKVTIP